MSSKRNNKLTLMDSTTRLALLSQEPIIFTTPPKNVESSPPNFDPGPDVILDPSGGLYCIVCKTTVPSAEENVKQHLMGRKHQNNNTRRFQNLKEKEFFRKRVLDVVKQCKLSNKQNSEQLKQEGKDKEINKADQNPDKPLLELIDLTHQTTEETNQDLSDGEIDSEGEKQIDQEISQGQSTIEKTNKVKTVSDKETDNDPTQLKATVHDLTQADKLKSIQFDKQAFVAKLVADSGSEDEYDNTTTATNDDTSDDENNSSSNLKSLSIEQRKLPFGPISILNDNAPDLFFDTMPEETQPSEHARKVKQMLSDAVATKKNVVDTKSQDGSDSGELSEDANLPQEQFISLESAEKTEDDGDKHQSKKQTTNKKTMSKESIADVQLKDTNGEMLPPWMLDSVSAEDILYSRDSSEALHYEILEFEKFVSPTKEETDSRNETIMVVESIVKQLWPASKPQIFGSYATNLCLPASDIDICVMNTPDNGSENEFQQLANAIRNVPGFAKRVTIIKAKVSLVKIVSKKSSINCDISIGVDNGVRNVPVIKRYVEEMPALRPLLLVIKCFVQQRNLNEVFRGGLGSYTILLLVVSHLQMLRYNFPEAKANLGNVLFLFMRLYGRLLNISLVGIRCKDNGSYFDKYEVYNTERNDIIRYCIEDPNDVTNELGRNGFAVNRVRRAFRNASDVLSKWRRDNASCTPTPLSSIIQCDIIFQQRRKSVIEDMREKGMNPLEGCLPRNIMSGIQRSSDQLDINHQMSFDTNYGNQNIEDDGRTPPRKVDRSYRRDPRTPKRRRISGSNNDVEPMNYMNSRTHENNISPYNRNITPVAVNPGYQYTNANNMMYDDNSIHAQAGYPGSSYDSYGQNRSTGQMNLSPHTPYRQQRSRSNSYRSRTRDHRRKSGRMKQR